MKILKSWTEFERWSAHDSDDFYYMIVEHKGEKYKLRSDKPWEIDEIEKEILRQQNKNIKKLEEKSQMDRAMERLNQYDYKEGKSVQESLWLLRDLKTIFTEQ